MLVATVVVACVVAVAGGYEGLRLVNGGYEGLVVAITDHVPQQHCNQVILGIKVSTPFSSPQILKTFCVE